MFTYTHSDGTTRDVTVRRQLYDGTQFRLEYFEAIAGFSGPLKAAMIHDDLAEAFWDQYNSDEALTPIIEYAVGEKTENELRDLYDLDPIDPPPDPPPGM
jgi:hypothetical protein